MTRPEHLFVSNSDGALYDTRVERWSHLAPLRPVFNRSYARITCAAELKATLRNGPFAWPGCYPLYFIMQDGEAMSFESVQSELRRVLEGMRDKDSEWTPCAVEINYEDSDLTCAHSGKRIESAYAEDETESDQ